VEFKNGEALSHQPLAPALPLLVSGQSAVKSRMRTSHSPSLALSLTMVLANPAVQGLDRICFWPLSTDPPATWLSGPERSSCSKMWELTRGWQSHFLWLGFQLMASVFMPFKTNPTQWFYQTLEIYYFKSLTWWKYTRNSPSVANVGATVLWAWAFIFDVAGSGWAKINLQCDPLSGKIQRCLREPPVNTAHSLLPAPSQN
jgi:hypothetical protein